jgi:hypothetical protein
MVFYYSIIALFFLAFPCFSAQRLLDFSNLLTKGADDRLAKETDTQLVNDPILDERSLRRAGEIKRDALNEKTQIPTETENLQKKVAMKQNEGKRKDLYRNGCSNPLVLETPELSKKDFSKRVGQR